MANNARTRWPGLAVYLLGLAGFLVWFAFAAPFTPSYAQKFDAYGAGALTATAYEPIETDASVGVVIRENSELNTRLREDAVLAFQAAGRETDQRGEILLYIETEIVGRGGSRSKPGLGTLTGDTEYGVDFRVNIFSNTQDSLLTGRQDRGDTSVLYILSGEARRGRTVVWQGSVETGENLGDIYRTFRPMVRTLIDSLGENAVGEDGFE